MSNWNLKTKQFEEPSDKLLDFFQAIDEVCLKFNLSISHEDEHGAFIIEDYSKVNAIWLKLAHLNYRNEEQSEQSPNWSKMFD